MLKRLNKLKDLIGREKIVEASLSSRYTTYYICDANGILTKKELNLVQLKYTVQVWNLFY